MNTQIFALAKHAQQKNVYAKKYTSLQHAVKSRI